MFTRSKNRAKERGLALRYCVFGGRHLRSFEVRQLVAAFRKKETSLAVKKRRQVAALQSFASTLYKDLFA